MLRLPSQIDECAQSQFGLVTLPQLLAACSRSKVERFCAAGLLFRTADPGVLRVVGAQTSFRQRALGLTICRPNLAISHLAAAHLYQAPSVIRPPLSATAMSGRGPTNRPDTTIHRRRLRPCDVTKVSGIAVTAPSRTVLDLSTKVEPSLVRAIYDDLARDRRLGPVDLERRLNAGDLPSVRRQVLDDLLGRRRGLGPGGSPKEDWMLDVILDAQLPPPVRNYRIWLPGGVREVDLAYVDQRVALDYDGWRVHGDRTHFDRDRERAAELLDAGWELFQVTASWSAEMLVARVRRALERRGGLVRG